MTEYKQGIYAGPKTLPSGKFDPNVMLIKDISDQTEVTIYGEVGYSSHTGNWDRNMSKIETDTLIAPWVLSKWS